MGTSWTQKDFERLERMHPRGMTVQQIVEVFTGQGDKLTEATFRKYVQLGLLPRSVRVGRKGKHKGSQGLYPATAVRQIDWIRQLMAQGFTMDEIQREFLFVRGELDVLSRQLERVLMHISEAAGVSVAEGAVDPINARAISEATTIAQDLINKLRSIEQRLSMQARMARAAV
ncbi:MAG: hypothetical protein IPJ88_11155 [Myxococcales bacterium]|nr:MAG: hypothetical protein IPJ88_11155 [Myxococcales bacterium]